MQNRFRFTRGLLPRAWDCLTSWQQKLPSSHRLPLTILLLRVLFIVAISQGLEDFQPAYLLIPGAVLLRVGYFGLLRPRELLAIRAKHVSFGEDGQQSIAIIAIMKPKTRKLFGKTQFAIIYEPGTVAWLKWLVDDMHPDARLWPSTRFAFNKLFYNLLQRLGLSRLHITPGCLWAGRLQFMSRGMQGGSLGACMQEAMSMLV